MLTTLSNYKANIAESATLFSVCSCMKAQFVPEWAQARNIKQKDIVNSLGVDKGSVSRWFSSNRTVPIEKWRVPLAKLLDIPVNYIFISPDEVDNLHIDENIEQRFNQAVNHLGEQPTNVKALKRAIEFFLQNAIENDDSIIVSGDLSVEDISKSIIAIYSEIHSDK